MRRPGVDHGGDAAAAAAMTANTAPARRAPPPFPAAADSTAAIAGAGAAGRALTGGPSAPCFTTLSRDDIAFRAGDGFRPLDVFRRRDARGRRLDA